MRRWWDCWLALTGCFGVQLPDTEPPALLEAGAWCWRTVVLCDSRMSPELTQLVRSPTDGLAWVVVLPGMLPASGPSLQLPLLWVRSRQDRTELCEKPGAQRLAFH